MRARILYGLYKSAEDPMTVDEIAAEFNLPVDAVSDVPAIVEARRGRSGTGSTSRTRRADAPH
jgi:hypothetical protein